MTSTLLSLFDAEIARTAAVLRAVPDASLDWTPDPRSFTLGRLAMHVATLPGWRSAFTTSRRSRRSATPFSTDLGINAELLRQIPE